MTKETFLILFIISSLSIMPGTAFSAKSIQTAQHIIVLDPGHGGAQNGLVTSTGLTEKKITLILSKKIVQKLENSFNVNLTRTTDIEKSPRERMHTANQLQADLFISIHLHNSGEPAAFFYHFDLPGNENTGGTVKSTWTSSPLLFKKKSRKAARMLSEQFSDQKPSIAVHIRKAPVLLLEGSTMPSVLIEPFSISTLPRHPARLEIILEEYAQLTANAIEHYFNYQ